MASFTLTATPFPDGTAVGAYNATGYNSFPTNGPPGSPVETETASNRSVTFTNLASGTAYFAAALVSGKWRYVRIVTADGGVTVNSSQYISAKDSTFGAIGNGTNDDTTALQNAINAAISAKLPLYLPPGTYKITSGLKAEAEGFSIFGAGQAWSKIKASANSFDALTIGSGSPGTLPSGYARDFGITGGGSTAEVTKAGAASTTGKAAFKLNGICLYEVTNVSVSGEFDIAFDAVSNCYGTKWNNARSNLSSCRVGMNVREGPISGNDWTFVNCWLSGEVAAVHITAGTSGFHFYGGQLNSNFQGSAAEDLKGAIILGKDYVTGTIGSDMADIDFNGMDFELCNGVWFCRAFCQGAVNFSNCDFIASSPSGKRTLGVYKNSADGNSHQTLISNRVNGTFAKNTNEIVVKESSFGGGVWNEMGTCGGSITTGSGTFDANDQSLASAVGLSWARATSGKGEYALLNNVEEQAAAATTALSKLAKFVKITGTTTITKITATYQGHEVTLRFSEALTLTDGENLKLAGNFVTTSDDTITLICSGTNWYEKCRSIN